MTTVHGGGGGGWGGGGGVGGGGGGEAWTSAVLQSNLTKTTGVPSGRPQVRSLAGLVLRSEHSTPPPPPPPPPLYSYFPSLASFDLSLLAAQIRPLRQVDYTTQRVFELSLSHIAPHT